MDRQLLDKLPGYWNGRRWQLWTLAAGFLSVPLSLLIALILSVILGERLVPLIMLVLVAVILVASLIGSGFIDTLTSQLNRGGLARDASEHVEGSLSKAERDEAEERNRMARDRRTIRAGLFVLPPLIAFIYLMTIV